MPNNQTYYQYPIKSISLTGNMMQIVAVIDRKERQIPVRQIFILPVLAELEKRGFLQHLLDVAEKIRNEIILQSQRSRSRTAEAETEALFNNEEAAFLVDNMLLGRTNYEGSLFLHFDDSGRHSSFLANISRSRSVNTILAFDLDDTLVNTSNSYHKKHEIEVLDGVVDLIRDLIFAGVRVVVITHSLHTYTAYAQAFIEALASSNLDNHVPIISISDIKRYFNSWDEKYDSMNELYNKARSSFMMQIALSVLNIPASEIHNYNLIMVGDNIYTDGVFSLLCKQKLGFKNVNYILASWYREEPNTEEYKAFYEQLKNLMLDFGCKILRVQDKITFRNVTRDFIRQFFTFQEQSQIMPTAITMPRDDTCEDEKQDKILYVVELVDLIIMLQNSSVASCIDTKALDAVNKLSERHKVVIVGHMFDLGQSNFLSQIKQEFALNRNVQVLTFNRSGEMHNMHPMHRHMRNFGKFHSMHFMETALTRFGISQEELNNYHLRIIGNLHHYEMQFARRCKSMDFKSVSLFMVLVREVTYLHRELRHSWERFASLHGIICEHKIYSLYHDQVHPIHSLFVEPELDAQKLVIGSDRVASFPIKVAPPPRLPIKDFDLDIDGNPCDTVVLDIEDESKPNLSKDDWGAKRVVRSSFQHSTVFNIHDVLQGTTTLQPKDINGLPHSRSSSVLGLSSASESFDDLESEGESHAVLRTQNPPPAMIRSEDSSDPIKPIRVSRSRVSFSSRVVEERSLKREYESPDAKGMQ